MRICSPQLGISQKSILGGEVFDREILLRLAKRGIKIEIILPKNLPHYKNIKNWQITFLPIKHIPAPLFNLIVFPYLLTIYKKRPFDLIRLHSPMYVGLGALLFKFFQPKVKIIATFHQFRETKIYNLGRLINQYWDHIICDSNHVKRQIMRTYKIPHQKITIVHNGVPPYLKPVSKDQKLIKKLKLENKVALLFMGLFIKRKNPLFLLKVLKRITEENSNVCIIFWGRGPLKLAITKKAKELGIFDRVRIMGPIFGEEKNKIHNLADIFVHPSLDEGFALAPLEAMACAKPIIMTRSFSADEAVENGSNGFLCNSNDSIDWSEKLLKLINNRKLREKMGQASLAKVKKEFQWEIATQKHAEVFNRLLK